MNLSRPSLVFLLLTSSACSGGNDWVKRAYQQNHHDRGVRIYDARQQNRPGAYDKSTSKLGKTKEEDSPPAPPEQTDSKGPRPQVKLVEKKRPPHKAPADGRFLGKFRNTYYDFPAEANFTPGSFARSGKTGAAKNQSAQVTLMDRSCSPIKKVARSFFESLCVQGSGTMIDGRTVSFAKRDCECAEICPRTSQNICFEALDPHEFPWGRGALGKPITPLLSVAVDSEVIPLGTQIYIAEYDGVERRAGGGRHDGCFVAEDRGMKVQGRHVDIFTGNPNITEHLNALVPSNFGVHVYIGTSRCQR